MPSSRWISLLVAGLLAACATAPVGDDYNQRGSGSGGDDQSSSGSTSSSGSSATSTSSSSGGGSSSSGGSTSSSSSGTSTPTDAGTSSGSPPTTSSPTGSCSPTTAPAQCTALDPKGGVCSGLARCQPGVTPTWGPCQCGLVAAPITTTNDCVTFNCPASAPNVVGCALTFSGSDAKGCAARSAATPGTVFLKEGDKCGSGGVGGTVFCSPNAPTAPLDAVNCTMNKSTKLYPTSAGSCP